MNPSSHERISALAETEYEALLGSFPAHPQLGGQLFLGKHYAAVPNGILMLGLNPGRARQEVRMECELLPENPLVTDGWPAQHGYWRNARRCFGTDEVLKGRIEQATFAFCSPFRTSNWNLAKSHRDAIVAHSRPIMRQLLADCSPRVVIVAGKAGLGAFLSIAGDAVDVVGEPHRGPYTKGTYQWSSRPARIDAHAAVLLQVPHFSRASSPGKLDECRGWLAREVELALS